MHNKRVGVAASVVRQVEGVIGGDTRDISLSAPVFMSELIRTRSQSGFVMRFLDNTVLLVDVNEHMGN